MKSMAFGETVKCHVPEVTHVSGCFPNKSFELGIQAFCSLSYSVKFTTSFVRTFIFYEHETDLSASKKGPFVRFARC